MTTICIHRYTSLGIRASMGDNLLGRQVVALIEDFKCEKCDNITIQLIKDTVSRKDIKLDKEVTK